MAKEDKKVEAAEKPSYGQLELMLSVPNEQN